MLSDTGCPGIQLGRRLLFLFTAKQGQFPCRQNCWSKLLINSSLVSVYLSVCFSLFLFLSFSLFVCLCLSLSVSVCLSYLSRCPSVSVYLYVCLCISVFCISVSFYLSLSLSLSQLLCLSVCVSLSLLSCLSGKTASLYLKVCQSACFPLCLSISYLSDKQPHIHSTLCQLLHCLQRDGKQLKDLMGSCIGVRCSSWLVSRQAGCCWQCSRQLNYTTTSHSHLQPRHRTLNTINKYNINVIYVGLLSRAYASHLSASLKASHL